MERASAVGGQNEPGYHLEGRRVTVLKLPRNEQHFRFSGSLGIKYTLGFQDPFLPTFKQALFFFFLVNIQLHKEGY